MTTTLLEHYKLEQKLEQPFIEYSRYILTSGTESERTTYTEGFTTKPVMTKGNLKISK